MPEGDAIFRTARTLNRAMAGREVVWFESVFPALTRVHEDAPIIGRTVERVTAAGKHVLVHFSGRLVLRTHMRMNGSWHIYRPGERHPSERRHRDVYGIPTRRSRRRRAPLRLRARAKALQKMRSCHPRPRGRSECAAHVLVSVLPAAQISLGSIIRHAARGAARKRSRGAENHREPPRP